MKQLRFEFLLEQFTELSIDLEPRKKNCKWQVEIPVPWKVVSPVQGKVKIPVPRKVVLPVIRKVKIPFLLADSKT